MIWLLLFITLLVANCLVFIFYPDGTIRELLLIVISVVIGAIGFSFKDYLLELKQKRKLKDKQQRILKFFNEDIGKALNLELNNESLTHETEDTEILLSSLENKGFDNNKKNMLILCYFCKKWDKTKAVEDLEKIKQYSELSEIKYAKVNKIVKAFLDIYKIVFNREEKKYELLLNHFITNFYKDLQFYPLIQELNQTKNFHETLVKIIKEGKLSNYGITKETLKRLQRDLYDKSTFEKTFIVLLNKANDEIKDYLRSLPGLSGSSPSVRNIKKNAKYSLFVVKPTKIKSAKEFLQILKNKISNGDEVIFQVIPLDFVHSQVYAYPANKSFTNKNMKECYEAIEWFKSGQMYLDSGVWNEIAKSTISPNELLNIVPFNIFCPGILPSEQAFLIKNYDGIKSKASVNSLTDWKDKDADYIVECMLTFGVPDYNNEEMKYLKISPKELEKKSKERLLEISKQIIAGAEEFSKAIDKKNEK